MPAVAALGAAALLAACLFETEVPVPGREHKLDYTVTPGTAGEGARVEILLRAWPEGEARIFQAPVYYSDNPAYPLRGYRAVDLSVTDRQGRPLVARDTLLPGLALDGNFIVLPAAARSLAYTVDLAPADPARFGVPIPGTAAGVDLIDGAAYFILPLLGRDFASQWRAPAQVRLAFNGSSGRDLYGTDPVRRLSTNYELMFVRGSWGAVQTRVRAIRNHELNLYATSGAALDLDAFGGLLERCIRVVEDSLLPLPTFRYFAGENPAFWGIEGVQGYWFKGEAAALPHVHVHELVHTFVGVYHSDLEDPWWKESMTNYLGLLLSVQSGLIGDTAFAAEMLIPRGALPSVRDFALAAPHVRNHLFLALDSAYAYPPDPEDYAGLIYGKGAQASMILDRWLLEHSIVGRGNRNRKSVFDLIKLLIGRHGPAFRRADLVSAADDLTGASSREFLAALLDRAAPLPLDSLHATFRALRALGRFGPSGGKLPVPGVDGATPAMPKAATVTRMPPRGAKL